MSQNQQVAAWGRLLNASMLAMRQQQFTEAAALLRQIVGTGSQKARQWPNFRQALQVYALALYRSGEIGESLIYQTKVLSLAPADLEARGNFLLLLKTGATHLPNTAEFRRVLHNVLEQADIGEYAVAAAQALLKDAAFAEVFELLRSGTEEQAAKALSQGRFRAMMQAPLLLLLLRNTLIPLPEYESVLRKLRKILLLTYARQLTQQAAASPGKIELEFIGALAHYIWLSEYAIPEDAQETALVEMLSRELEASLNFQPGPAWQTDLACHALYRSGLELSNCERLFDQPTANWKSYMRPLLREWRDYLEEQTLAGQIESLTPTGTGISEQVRRQYEENPFPRWRHDPVAHQRTTAAPWLADFAPGLRPPPGFDGAIDVLTAGCGTGLEPISLARQIQTRRFLALDLSRASLAYALRMARRLGLAEAIDFKQADITQLGGFTERFDLITASGVLHHLENPLAGWRILTELLKPGGVMLVSLYSASGRQSVIRARRLIAEQAWEATPERMRRLRRAVLAGEHEELKPLPLWRDFYNLSMFRDLVFHVNEHHFSIPLIQQHLAELDLRFICMRGLAPPLQARYRASFPQDTDGAAIANWARFEEEHPSTFMSMYGLVLQKPWAGG